MALSVTSARPPTLSPTVNASPPRLSPTVTATPPRLNTGVVTSDRPNLNNPPPSLPAAQPDYAALLRQTLSNQQAVAPKLDYAALSAQARSSAESNVNPFYTKSLNDFLAQQAAVKSQKQAATDTAIQGYQDILANTLKQNEVTGQRTAEDASANIGNINTQADQFQTDNGQTFDATRLQQARDLSQSGLTGGLGAQQQEAAQQANATTEARAGAQTTQDVQAQQLAKARTFEDLAQSGALAQQSKEKGVKAAQVDLTDFITNQGFDLENEQQKLEQDRLKSISQEQQNQSKLLLNQFLAKISDPGQYTAAVNAYGGLF